MYDEKYEGNGRGEPADGVSSAIFQWYEERFSVTQGNKTLSGWDYGIY